MEDPTSRNQARIATRCASPMTTGPAYLLARHKGVSSRSGSLARGGLSVGQDCRPDMVVVASFVTAGTYKRPTNCLRLGVPEGTKLVRKPEGRDGCVAEIPLKIANLSATQPSPLREDLSFRGNGKVRFLLRVCPGRAVEGCRVGIAHRSRRRIGGQCPPYKTISGTGP